MGKMLYLECESGISGDMTVAALLDAGASEDVLMAALRSLPLEGFDVRISRVAKAGIDCCDFAVQLDDVHQNHDHDMAYLHGNAEASPDEGSACGDHHHGNHGHGVHEDASAHEDHHHGEDHHAHAHRGLACIKAIIQSADISPRAAQTAVRIFDILAAAEAKAHGIPADQVHFHEVGAVDSIVDVVAVAVCLDDLDITDVVVGRMCEGRGCVRCQHGVLPIPVPAVANIAAEHGLPLRMTACEGELITPTGAAIVAAVRTQDALPPDFVIKRVGYGAGKRTYQRPSILRAMLIEDSSADRARAHVWKLETEVDDCPGEALGFVLDKLLAAGAREAHFAPVFMKKNRPGWQIEVLCSEVDIPAMEAILFHDTTTIGIRRIAMDRTALPRKIISVQTAYGPMRAKQVTLPDGTLRAYPEYDDVARVAREQGVAYQDAYRSVLSALG